MELKLIYVRNVLIQFKTFLQRLKFSVPRSSCATPLAFQSAHRCNDDSRFRVEARFSAFDIKELLRTKIGTETGLRDDDIGILSIVFVATAVLQPCAILAKTLHNRRVVLQRLHEIRRQGILKQAVIERPPSTIPPDRSVRG